MRCNLSMQGYRSLSDDERKQLSVGLRISPALCLTGMAVGVVLQSPAVLLGMAATAFLGGFMTRKHPFDLIWDYGLRRINDAPPLPATPAPRRFACQLATFWLIGLAAAFLAGADTLGTVLGIPLLVVAATVTTTNWCVPSLIYGLLHRRGAAAAPRA